jgi:hypothetical protein
LKTVEPERVPWVRIPPLPPFSIQTRPNAYEDCVWARVFYK